MSGNTPLPTASTPDLPNTPRANIQGVFLLFGRLLCLAAFAVVLVVFFTSIPAYVSYLHVIQPGGDDLYAGQLSVDGLQRLHSLGISLYAYITYLVGVKILFVSVWLLVGALIFLRKSDDPFALFVAFTLATFSVSFGFWAQAVLPQWSMLLIGLNTLSGVCISFMLPLIPDGHFVPRWSGWIYIIGTLFHQGLNTFFPQMLAASPLLSSLDTFSFIGGLLLLAVMQVYRYRRVSTPVQRQQIKWVVFGFSLAVTGFAVALFIGANYRTQLLPGTPFYLFQHALVFFSLLFIPLSIGMAILRSHLWDIDLIINRTLVYGLLTACIASLYVFVVAYIGTVFHSELNLATSLVAAGLVAVAFQPLRLLLQRGVNRLFYGLRDEPYVVLAGLSQQLTASLDTQAVLPTIVQSIGQALKLPYTAIEVNELNDENEPILTAACGQPLPGASLLRLPLVYRGQPVGALIIAPRSPSDLLTPADLLLLENLADQIGAAVIAVRLTADLQRSRERLVLAGEEERRRIRRDLHDGVGPTLASLSQRLDTARRMVHEDPESAIELLESLKEQVKSTIADIRRLVYALRPPVLDELGLVSAIQQQAMPLQEANELRIMIESPAHMPELPAAVEVAAYRITMEALTNAARHARAKNCQVRLEMQGNNFLCLSITDDGQGTTADYHAGVGITSMRERAAELGGMFELQSRSGEGTQIQVRLPLKP